MSESIATPEMMNMAAALSMCRVRIKELESLLANREAANARLVEANTLLWNSPDTTPEVQLGDEVLYWIAVDSKHSGRVHVFLAYYQNRPFDADENDGEAADWVLYSEDGEPIDSVGWVSNREHYDFDSFYERYHFYDQYKLLGWAEYTPPEFTGVEHSGGAGNGR